MWTHKTWERNAEVAVVRETAVSFYIFLCAICISPTPYFAITLLAPMINSMEEVMSETIMSFKATSQVLEQVVPFTSIIPETCYKSYTKILAILR